MRRTLIISMVMIPILLLISCTNSEKSTATTSQTQFFNTQNSTQASVSVVSSTSNFYTTPAFGIMLWAIIGIIGGILIISWQSKPRKFHHLDWKDMRVIGIPMVGIAIFGIGAINAGFGAGLTLLATLVVAFMAFMSFRQTSDLEVNHSRDAMLNEIRDWVINILKCGTNSNLELLTSNISPKKLDFMSSASIVFDLFALSKQSFYMSKIAAVLGSELEKSVKALESSIEQHIVLIKNEINDNKSQGKDETNKSTSVDRIGDHRQELDALANKVIEEITKLKAESLEREHGKLTKGPSKNSPS